MPHPHEVSFQPRSPEGTRPHRNPRVVGALPAVVGARHLAAAFDLCKNILERYRRTNTELNEEELAAFVGVNELMEELTTTPVETGPNHFGVMTKVDSHSQLIHSEAQSATQSPKNTDLGRRVSTQDRFRKAASFIEQFSEASARRIDLTRLSEFALQCSDVSLSRSDLTDIVAEQVIQSHPSISSCKVYFAEPDEVMIEDQHAPNSDDEERTMALSLCVHREEHLDDGLTLYFPLRCGTLYIGALTVRCSQPIPANATQMLLSVVGVASLSLRNQKLFDGLRWQHTKAEAMLTMATRLSRDNLEEKVLVQSIMNTAKQLTESDRCSIFLVNGPELQAYFEDGAVVTMSIDTGIAGHVAKTGDIVNIVDAYEDPRFNSSVDKATGYRTKTILCMPVVYEGTIVAVAQLINKLDRVTDGTRVRRAFTKRDEELFSTFSTFSAVSLRNCRINSNLANEKKKSEAILDVALLLSKTDIRDVNKIVQHVMLGAKKLMGADRASLFLLDKERNELYSTVADSTGGKEIRFPSGRGIAGVVASTAVGENIKDAYADDRFNRDIDKQFGYRTQSVLCEPIALNGEVLAVAQLVNKTLPDGTVTVFSHDDQEAFRTFALFAGISISNSHLLEFAVRAGKEAMELNNAREGVTSARRGRSGSVKLLAVSQGERDAVRAIALPSDIDFASPKFNLFTLRDSSDHPLDVAAALVVQLILSTGLPQKFGCTEEVLLNFVLQCRRKYRRVPYHNFYHVVDVCQTIHTFVFHGRVIEFITELEAFVLLITALVHDLDHMGVNNSFHLKTDSPLGILSSASGNNSVLEVHHCNLAIEILSDPESNVFMGVSGADLTNCYRGLIDCVLATDMARHGELLSSFASMAAEPYDKDDESKRRLVMMMILKAGDISNVTKPFEISRLWAMAVTEEFYQQGDIEKEKGVAVLPMFDRSANNELAKGQIGFINFVAGKFFDNVVTQFFKGMAWTTESVKRNKDTWQSLLTVTA